ncbi:HlyC/CorC family transporter [Pleionea sediminis]|uniref:HlyC/CorC family transporter n=1 Tax=Pleionea sediminis TaxID=2569479 RepID=UPI00118674D9|nr:HlyC/CorC family transporter [Pleionea sediminis]
MDELSTSSLILSFIALLFLSAFFSSSETGMMSINRYRLKNRVKKNHRAARLVSNLLKRPDRLIGIILIGNNLVNILATMVATVLAIRFWGEYGEFILPFVLTIVVLIFAEVTPKTLAAIKPERIAFPASFILTPLLKLLTPFVMIVNSISNGLLKLFGISVHSQQGDDLSSEELRTVVNEAGSMIPKRHQNMLLSILDLEHATVEDIMVPKNEITGVDLDEDINDLIKQLRNAQHTRLPVYVDSIDQVKGMLHARHIANLMSRDIEEITKEAILELMTPVYFVPEGTPLNTQLLKFQRKKQRIGMVVDEYGDIQGLVTIEDILEEIVGEFTTDFAATTSKDIHPQEDGSFMIDGTVTIRDLNKTLKMDLPTDGPKTLSGLIIEYLETIPQPGTGLKLESYPIEILQIKGNLIKSVKLWTEWKETA